MATLQRKKPMSEASQFLIYTAPDGAVKVDVFIQNETVWLTQKALAELFGVQRPAVTKHLGNIFTTGELSEDSVCSILEHTAGDGKNYSAKHYNLDAIIAVGSRVNSFQATQFRIWATRTLREFIIKGFVMDDERLKQGTQRGIMMKMAEWGTFLHGFLELSNYPILKDKGKVTALEAKLKAEGEYEIFRHRQDAEYLSDFDLEIKRLEGNKES